MAKLAEEQSWAVIDASGLILGRLASVVAKRLLCGECIAIVNCEKAVLSGRKLSRLKEARAFLEIGYPKMGPFHPRRPDQIIRRTIRGMLPRRSPKGRMAFKRLRVFLGVPADLKNTTFQTVPEADASKLKCHYITVGELAKEIGYDHGGK